MATAYEGVGFTPGSGDTAAVQEVNGRKAQVVAVDVSGGGSTEGPLAGREVGPGSGDHAVYVDPRPLAVRLTASVTPAATSHTAGDAVGGAQTFAGVTRANGGSGAVVSVVVTDTADAPTKFAGHLALFRTSPTASDDAAFTPSDAEAQVCVGVVSWAAGDWVEWVNNAVVAKQVSIPFVADAAADDLFGVIVTTETKTFAASAIQTAITAYQD